MHLIVEGRSGGRLGKNIRGGLNRKAGGLSSLSAWFPYNFLDYALDLTRIEGSHFTIASFICMIPGNIAYVYIGYASREAMASNE